MAIRNLFNRMRQLNGFPGVITRGNSTCRATVRLGQNKNQATENGEFAVEADTIDLFIAAAEYFPGGGVPRPDVDDRICFVQRGVSKQYRVVIPTGADQCFANSDLEETELRVHCKKV